MIYFKYLINIVIIVVAIMSIMHIDFPYRKTVLYGSIIYIVLAELIRFLKRRGKTTQ